MIWTDNYNEEGEKGRKYDLERMWKTEDGTDKEKIWGRWQYREEKDNKTIQHKMSGTVKNIYQKDFSHGWAEENQVEKRNNIIKRLIRIPVEGYLILLTQWLEHEENIDKMENTLWLEED